MWPENWQAVCLFGRLLTQWRVAFSGPTGLDYCAAYPLMDRLNLSAPDWDAMLDDLQVMELEALATIRANQK